MRNPLRSEEDAFRLVLVTIAYGGLIVIGSAFAWTYGLALVAVATLLAVSWLLMGGKSEGRLAQAPPLHRPGERRILVIANETVSGNRLLSEIARRSPTDVLVVSPALNSPLRHWVSDEDDARATARMRLEASLRAMRAAGIRANGEIGDSEPLQAIEDALRTFAPDGVIISTHPPDRSNWLERDLITQARERFAVQITHVVVDLEAESEGLPQASGF